MDPIPQRTGGKFKKVAVFCGASSGTNPAYKECARALGQELVRRRIGLVYGGGLCRPRRRSTVAAAAQRAALHAKLQACAQPRLHPVPARRLSTRPLPTAGGNVGLMGAVAETVASGLGNEYVIGVIPEALAPREVRLCQKPVWPGFLYYSLVCGSHSLVV